ncbi:hypothetical protein NKDENANG_03948 [Candidatus Entotheonellaceae bacterium PAL068K]
MKFSKRDLDWAVGEGLLGTDQADKLWHALEARSITAPKFDLAHVAYYAGALIVISAMGWFMTEAWEQLGGGGIFVISTMYALCFVLAGRHLWYERHLRIPGGLLFTMAVCMTPLAIYGLERLTGIWPQGDPGTYRAYHLGIKGSWFLLEVSTVVVALVALRFVQFPFLTAPIAFSLWYMSMDLTPLIFGRNEWTWDERLWVSLWFGLAVLLVAYFIDRRTREDYAIWLYLFGILAFWGGLSLLESKSEIERAFYCLINVGLMFVSVLLQRRVLLVFGALGVLGYLGHLSYRVFQDALLFPFVLTIIGLLVIYLGVKYQRNHERIERVALSYLPATLKRLLPTERLTQ